MPDCPTCGIPSEQASYYLAGYEKAEEKAAAHREKLTEPGDTMQSSGSRVLTWLQSAVGAGSVDPPYEVHMAMIELDDAINEWTEARK